MYWSVLGCIISVEYVAEWLVSWIPFYYLMKTMFLLYLALPQTSGSLYLYKNYVQPFFAAHESEIDSALSQLKSHVYNYLQQLLRSAWGHVSSVLGQSQAGGPNALDEGGITGDAATHTQPPPSMADPVSGPVQLAQTFWRSYGPNIIASGATLLQQAQRATTAPAARAPLQTPPGGPSRSGSTFSVEERRRQLEAELASLPEQSPTIQPYDVGGSAGSSPTTPPVLIPAADNSSRSSSSTSVRERNISGAGRSTFEEIEVPSDMEGEGHATTQRPSQARRSSSGWFGGWGNTPDKGYERVKTE